MQVKQPKPIVRFSNADVKLKLPEKTKLKAFLIAIFAEEQVSLASLQYVFCSDEYLLNINRQFLNHDYYTDIITFPMQSSPDPVVGEIYISADRTADHAQTMNISPIEELLRVIFHGALHLCGYKDKTEKEKQVMRAKENEYLEKWSSFHVEHNP